MFFLDFTLIFTFQRNKNRATNFLAIISYPLFIITLIFYL
ncbi:hypothetical protein D068_cds19340 [Bacillus atrophaeus UCMB-5137]|nr:hypothetical protein D068_cds19340 [Bacillus atrophaeus UCMB-5137]